jgi:hypothetical protein
MLLPEALRDAVRDPRFWLLSVWDNEAGNLPDWDEEVYQGLTDCRVTFPVSPEYALVLELDAGLSYFSLGLQHPGAPEPVQVAWDDQAHWHPNVLRWQELDLIGRCVALQDPDLPHPGIPMLLLNRFTPICVGDDVDVIHPLLESAWRSLGVFDERQIGRQVDRYDRRQARFIWRQYDETGWALEQDEEARGSPVFYLYTLRSADNASFPFREWNRMVDQARRTCERAVDPNWLRANRGEVADLAQRVVESGDLGSTSSLAHALVHAGCEHRVLLDALRPPVDRARACWVIELLLGIEPGSFIRRHFGESSRPMRILYRFRIEIPTHTETFSLPLGSDARFAEVVDRALHEADLGDASVSGSTSSYSRDHTQVRLEIAHISATVRNDFDSGIRILRDSLRLAAAPEGTVVRLVAPEQRVIPLDPSTVG